MESTLVSTTLSTRAPSPMTARSGSSITCSASLAPLPTRQPRLRNKSERSALCSSCTHGVNCWQIRKQPRTAQRRAKLPLHMAQLPGATRPTTAHLTSTSRTALDRVCTVEKAGAKARYSHAGLLEASNWRTAHTTSSTAGSSELTRYTTGSSMARSCDRLCTSCTKKGSVIW
eukprot:scaffold13930_cov65-Phaeocystis_antarctica.AAC.9